MKDTIPIWPPEANGLGHFSISLLGSLTNPSRFKQVVVMAGLRPPDHPVLRKFSSGELDEERKQELIMEKKLRACRVSIIPKVSRVGRISSRS